MKNNTTYIIIGATVLILALFGLGQLTSGGASETWEDTDVACLPFGHQNLAFHSHPQVDIRLNGEEERIPANVGNDTGCMAEIHTHDASGRLHIESTDAGKQGSYTLADFFAVWGKQIQRDGYSLTASVNGSEVDEPEKITLRDGRDIVLSYESSNQTSTSTATTTEEASTSSSATTSSRR